LICAPADGVNTALNQGAVGTLPDSWIVNLLRNDLTRIGAPRRTGHMRWVSAAGTSRPLRNVNIVAVGGLK